MLLKIEKLKFKMRASTALLYAIIFISATTTLYFMAELMGRASSNGLRSSTDLTPDDASLVKDLERKLNNVESSIKRNHELVASLQARLAYMLKEQVPGVVTKEGKKVDVRPAVVERKEGKKLKLKGKVKSVEWKGVEVKGDQCPAGEWKQSSTDVQMLNAYDVIPFDNPDGGVWKQGWNISYSTSQWTAENPLKVFIIPHSHNDPGWIKTFEKYFQDQTKNIFDLMVRKMPAYPNRKFIWAEVSYLDLWWQTASDDSKTRFKKLVKEGQVEIVTGGWVMPDESSAHYSAILDQLIEGHEWIANHLGHHIVPQHGWSIDPFGMSPTVPYIEKLMRFKGKLIQRVHYSVKKHLAKEKSLEFFWRQNWDQGKTTDILTHMMPFYSYDVPHTCGPDPKICCQFDFKRLPGSGKVSCPWKIPPRAISTGNVQERSETLLDQYRRKAQLYKTNVLLIPLGDDFRYDTAQEWDQQYINYEKIIKYVNGHPEYNTQIQFGTLGDYFTALTDNSTAASDTFPTLSGDFFTYADRDDHYWSGYFTSRPFYKMMERTLEARLRATEIAFSLYIARAERLKHTTELATLDAHLNRLVKARRNLALFQHHDAIAGTAKTAVVQDYAAKMIGALDNCGELLGRSLGYLLQSEGKKSDSPTSSTTGRLRLRLDETYSSWDQPKKKERLMVEQDGQFIVVWNSLGFTRSERITVRVSTAKLAVVEMESKAAVTAQINPLWNGKTESITADEYELTFVATVTALGAVTFMLVEENSLLAAGKSSKGSSFAEIAGVETYAAEARSYDATGVFDMKALKYSVEEILLENHNIQAAFEGRTGLLKKLALTASDTSLPINLSFQHYGTTTGDDKSGAYLFLPGPNPPEPLPLRSPLIRVIRGSVVQEVHLVLPELTHIVRLTNSPGLDSQSLEIENRVDVTKKSNYELAMKMDTGVNSGREFFTDLNGFQLIRRKLWEKIPVQGNWYPMPTMAFVEDDDVRVTVASGQPLGVASLKSGSLEIMLDRRLDQDDNRGVAQGVQDNIPSTPSYFRLLLESNRPSLRILPTAHPFPTISAHAALTALLHPLMVMFSEKPSQWSVETVTGRVKGLVKDLPCDVHLLNLRTSVEKETDDGLASAGKSGGEGEKGPQGLLLLHRIGVDCRRAAGGLQCPLDQRGKVNLKTTFRDLLSLPFVEEGSPSPLHKGDLLPVDATVELEPMHIRAFRFPLV